MTIRKGKKGCAGARAILAYGQISSMRIRWFKSAGFSGPPLVPENMTEAPNSVPAFPISRILTRPLAALLIALLAAACASTPPPRTGGYKVGTPYQVGGVWYYPHEDPFYDETGIASWYGDAFKGRPTANGEIFQPSGLTAAHKTLPLPVLVRVTNLQNGKSIVLRVNDRGPFIPGRIIDVSEKAAELLGFKSDGVARVRVQYVGRADGSSSDEAAPPVAAAAPTDEVASNTLAPPPGTTATPTRTVETGPRPVESTRIGSAAAVDGTVTTVAVPQSTQLWVQAGSFRSRQNADRLRNRLSSTGDVRVTSTRINGQQFWRVRLGPFASLREADAALERVIAGGQPGAHIVVE